MRLFGLERCAWRAPPRRAHGSWGAAGADRLARPPLAGYGPLPRGLRGAKQPHSLWRRW